MSARPLYHSFAWAYDAVVASPGGPEAQAIAAALHRRGVGPGAALLDAGCGSGRYSVELAAEGFEVTGADRSEELVALARDRAGGGTRFVVADLCDWSLRERFDAVLCRGVLNDLVDDADRQAAFGGLRRALRPGGVLVLDVRDWDASVDHYTRSPNFERSAETDHGALLFTSSTALDIDRRLLLVHERVALDGGQPQEFDFVMRPWTPTELEAALGDAGFAHVELQPPDLRPARADRIVAIAG